jgi:hypothetical protein
MESIESTFVCAFLAGLITSHFNKLPKRFDKSPIESLNIKNDIQIFRAVPENIGTLAGSIFVLSKAVGREAVREPCSPD